MTKTKTLVFRLRLLRAIFGSVGDLKGEVLEIPGIVEGIIMEHLIILKFGMSDMHVTGPENLTLTDSKTHNLD